MCESNPTDSNLSQETTEQHTILFVDDEQNILNALRRLFYREPYKILMTTHPEEALQWVRERSVALVISDHRMPEMEGTKLLSKVREINADTIRIMLTGYADMTAAQEAINDSRVYRFISKPWNDDDLRLVVKEALRQYDLVKLNGELTGLVKEQNQELYDINRNLEAKVEARAQELSSLNKKLEAGYLDTINALTGVMELKNGTLVGHARRTAMLVKKIARHLELSHEEQIYCEMSALLMDIGMMGSPDNLFEEDENEMSVADRSIYHQHPIIGETVLKEIEYLRSVASNVRAHHERYDGKGFPDGLSRNQIPLPARIIAVVDHLDYLVNPPGGGSGSTMANAIIRIENEQGKRLDPEVVHALIDVVKHFNSPVNSDEIEIKLSDLKEGMILSRDLKTGSGVFLLPADNDLKAVHLERIQNFHRIDPIIDRIYIYRKREEYAA